MRKTFHNFMTFIKKQDKSEKSTDKESILNELFKKGKHQQELTQSQRRLSSLTNLLFNDNDNEKKFGRRFSSLKTQPSFVMKKSQKNFV